MYVLVGVALVLVIGVALTAVALPRSVKRRGLLVDGRGLGAVVVSRLNLQPRLGYEPYEGTANLRLDRRVNMGKSIATVRNGRKVYDIWPVQIEGRDCHVIWGRHWRTDSTTLEVLAPVRLRDSGDVFDIELRHRALPTWTFIRRRARRWRRPQQREPVSA